MQKKIVLLVVCLATAVLAFAQDFSIDQLEGLNIRNIGPAGMSGRVTCIDVDLSDPDRIFIGTASGGVWKSETGGISWEPIFDEEDLQSIGSIAINQKNPDEIWVGTGEGNPRNSMNSGAGIYRTLDGGKNWTLMGLKETRLIHRIIIHRDNPDIIYAGTLGSAWGPNPERGVYRSQDGGKTWKNILYQNEETGCADLVVDPTNPNKLIAAMWEFGRKPYTFNSGGEGSGMFVTYDGGDTWTERTEKDGLPKGNLGRMGLAIAPSKPSIVYALIEAKENALYKSTDGGFTFKKMPAKDNIGNRPFYYADIFVDPQNENRLWSLYSVISRSEDGGRSFQQILPYVGFSGVHPDHHAFWIHPEDPDYIISGNDGGLNFSRDRGNTWRFVENLPVGQFYHVNYDMDYPYNVCGGMQDNGSWVGPSTNWQWGGIRNHEWQEVLFGDGFDVVIQPDDPNYGFAMSQGGNVYRFNKQTGQTWNSKPLHPEGIPLRFNWNAAIAQDPFLNNGIYFGSQFVHYSDDLGQSWKIISPDLTTNDTTKQKQHLSGGLTIDDTRAENYTTIVAIAPSPKDRNVIWVGTDDGNIQLTRDGGDTWTNLSPRIQGLPENAWVTQIEVSTHNAGEAFMVVNNYRQNDWRPMVFHTKDFGQSFQRIVTEKEASGHALSIVQDLEEPGLLFLGTDHGLYLSLDYGRNWTKWTKGYPSVPTQDLKIHPREHDLIIGTFGRSIWIMDDIRPLRSIAKSKAEVLNKPLATFPAPDAYQVTYRSVDGNRFVADAHYSGQNRPRGAMLTLWIHPDSLQKDLTKKVEVKVEVKDMEGTIIRTYKRKVDSCFNRMTWNLRQDGFRFPSRRTPKAGSPLPSGTEVVPGEYEVVFSYKDYRDSTRVKVVGDPRNPNHTQAMQNKQQASKELAGIVEVATEGFSRLREARKTIKLVDGQLGQVPDSTKQEIVKLGKSMVDSIQKLEDLYMLPQGLKGIQRTPDVINNYLYTASSYLRSSDWSRGEASQMATYAVEQAREKVDEAIAEINTFFAEDWKAYQEKVESIPRPIFKEYEALERSE